MSSNDIQIALPVDENLADQVWEAWDAGSISDELAALAWSQIYSSRVDYVLGVGD